MQVIGLAGWSRAGKTTLLTRLIPHCVPHGLRVSTVKHAHHDFDLDVPGKDSWLHRKAGASEVLVSSSRRWAMVHELGGGAELSLPDLLAKMSPVDLVVVEGFKSEPHRKIEVHRAAVGKPLLSLADSTIVGIVSDFEVETSLPVAHLDDIQAIASMMLGAAVVWPWILNGFSLSGRWLGSCLALLLGRRRGGLAACGAPTGAAS